VNGRCFLQTSHPRDHRLMPTTLTNSWPRVKRVAHENFRRTHMTKVWEPCASTKGAKLLLASEPWEFRTPGCYNFTTAKTLECRSREVTWAVDLRIPRNYPNHWIYVVVSPMLTALGDKGVITPKPLNKVEMAPL
jgi:hypothetical protein